MSTRKRLSADQRREVIERAALGVFAERGYHHGSIDEIARRSGVTPPVIYDHFASKAALHERLLERTRDELLAMWRDALAGDEPPDVRVPRAIDAWARYVQEHPYAPRMFFHETTGVPEIQAAHRRIQDQARAALAVLVGGETPGDRQTLEMTAEVVRAGLTGLAIWWSEHPEVPRDRIVAVALATVWEGLAARAR